MNTDNTNDAKTLMAQATATTHSHLIDAVDCIDHFFGEGYAKAHPELVGQFIRTAAEDYKTAMTVQAIQGVKGALSEMKKTIASHAELYKKLNRPPTMMDEILGR